MTEDSRFSTDTAQFSRILRNLHQDIRDIQEGDRGDTTVHQLRDVDHTVTLAGTSLDIEWYSTFPGGRTESDWAGLSDREKVNACVTETPVATTNGSLLTGVDLRRWAIRAVEAGRDTPDADTVVIGNAGSPSFTTDSQGVASRVTAVPIPSAPIVSGEVRCRGLVDYDVANANSVTELAIADADEEQFFAHGIPDSAVDKTNSDILLVDARVTFAPVATATEATTTRLGHRLGRALAPISSWDGIDYCAFGRGVPTIATDTTELDIALKRVPISDWDHDDDASAFLQAFVDPALLTGEEIREVGLAQGPDGLSPEPLSSVAQLETLVEKTPATQFTVDFALTFDHAKSSI